MPRKIWAIITYHKKQLREDAAETWKEERVAAVGWSKTGDLRKVKTFSNLSEKCSGRGPSTLWTFYKEIKKKDLIFAYATDNIIAYVGEVDGPYVYEKGNKIGLWTKEGFGYSHQRNIKWWSSPHYFSRKKLPMDIAEQFGLQGSTITEIDPGSYRFNGLKNFLKNNAEALTDSGFRINEDTVKAGIRKYLRTHIDNLEKGLKITHAESGVADRKRPDFKARDVKGNLVLIECKGTADEDAVDQTRKYLNKFKREKGTRALIIAFKITRKCRASAQKHNIELYECNLAFNRV